MSMVFSATGIVGAISKIDSQGPIPDAAEYRTPDVGAGTVYEVGSGGLSGMNWLAMDMLAAGEETVVFQLSIGEESGRAFHLAFMVIMNCSLRMRLPLSATDQNTWGLNREGAYVKPTVYGDRIDLAKVRKMTLTILRKGNALAQWWMSDIRATAEEPPRIDRPILPKGALIDEFGQSRIRKWPTKTRSEQELKNLLQQQLVETPTQRWPGAFSSWGGDGQSKVNASGYFRTHHDGRRWWLVDPDGHLFWSTGLDCVRPDPSASYEGLESAMS
jgi:hypothetical protein